MVAAPPLATATAVAPHDTANLNDAGTRDRLTGAAVKAYKRVAEAWGLTNAEAAVLAGLSERTWMRMKASGTETPLGADSLTRLSALIGIYKGLHLLFSNPLADRWPTMRNTGPLFNGLRPVDALLQDGIPGMIEVRAYVDALRGGL